MSALPLEDPRSALLRMVGGYRVTQALYVASTLGIPDLLAGSRKDATALAKATGTDPDRLHRLLRALATIGVFTVDEQGRFGLTDVGSLLRTDPQGSMRPVAIFAGEDAYRAWGDLLHAVRSGETAFDHLYGMGHFDYLESHPDSAATFNAVMAWSVGLEGFPLQDYDFGGHRVVVDIGGGRGALLAATLRAHPHLRGILFDQATAVADAPGVLRAEGVADRCEIVTGSAFETVPPGGDVCILSRILHDWPDEQALRLLANCRKAMPAGGTLLLVDGVLPVSDPPPSRAWLDLVMMVMTGGRERTEAEWRALLRRAGFALVRVRPSRTNQDLIEARAE
jgi:O-methyltransferase domain/Dimerisation domain